MPGKYGKLVAKNMDKLASVYANNRFRLQCGHCGKTGEYNLGTVAFDISAYDKEKPSDSDGIIDYVQASAYFRCKHCNGAGNWELGQAAKGMLQLGLMSAMVAKGANIGNFNSIEDRFMFGAIIVDGNFKPRWGTDAEEHFLAKLEKNSQDAYLWNRLGNYFYRNGRTDVAATVFEYSLKIDKTQMESYFTLGNILYEIEAWEEASWHLRQALVYASRYNAGMPALRMRDMLVNALVVLFDINAITNGEVDPMPTPEELAIMRAESKYGDTDSNVFSLIDIEIFPDRPETLIPLAEMYMGKRRDELPAVKRKLKLPVAAGMGGQAKMGNSGDLRLAAKINKQKPRKKKDKNKRRK